MLRPRVIPVLTLHGRGLVKTMKFRDPLYLGDPINALRIFNTKEVDEIVVLDITATREGRTPDLGFLRELASECFMPVAYGGGVRTLDAIQRVLEAGVEKVCLNTIALRNHAVVTTAAAEFGSQAVVVSLDARRARIGGIKVIDTSGSKPSVAPYDPPQWARMIVDAGAGELLVTSVDRDGTGTGYDLDLIETVTRAVNVPVIACGGAGTVEDLQAVLALGAAAAAGRMFVTHGKHRASLVSYLDANTIGGLLG